MKTVAVALALLGMGATPGDLKYESSVREAFAELEAKCASLAEETKTENPDRLVPLLVARRSLWRSENGEFFERLNNGFFVHKTGTGEAKLFNTTERRSGYVELALVEGGWLIRLYEDHMEVKGPGKDFKRQSKGRWER